MIKRSRYPSSQLGRTRSKYDFRSALLVLLSFVVFFVLCAAVSAQTAVPATVLLKPGFVGGRYEVPLTNLLPVGTAPINWTLLANGTAADGTVLQTPAGVTIDNVNKKLVVAPIAAALKVNAAGQPKNDPYFFELQGADGSGNLLTIRFSLIVRPFGVDESRLRSLSGSVASFNPAHDTPAPGAPPPPFVLSTSTADEETIVLDQKLDKAQPPVAGPDFSQQNRDKLVALIDGTVGSKKGVVETTETGGVVTVANATNFQAGDYLLVHVIVWKPVKAEEKADAQRQLWGLFKAKDKNNTEVEWEAQGDPADKNVFNSRIFGGKRVAVLLINFNTPSSWDVKYTVALNQRIPTPIQNLLTLAANIAPAGGGAEAAAAPPPKDIWGARMMLVRYPASDMLVKVNTITANETEVEQAKDYSKKYLNEGRYHWDVSVGLPIKSIKELQYKTDANNRVTTEAKERQSAYGFLNIFPKAVDLSGESFLTVPHFVFGVPLASKPLHHPFAGLGYGVYKTPIKFNIFAGVVFNRERVPRTLNVGNSATSSQLDSDLRTHWVRKFMFGVNFPISQIKNAIKNK